MPLRVFLCLLICATCATARAQAVIDAELASAPPPELNEPKPNVYTPFAMLVPGVVSMVTGGGLFLEDPPHDGVYIGMMAGGAALAFGSGIFFTVQLVRRARWRRAQAWARCHEYGEGCRVPRPERMPTIYQPIFMFLPGAVLAISGSILFRLGQEEIRSAHGDFDGDMTGYMDRDLGSGLIGAGASAILGSAIYLAVRLTKRARFRREHGEQDLLSSLRVAPALSRDVSGRRAPGVLLHATF